ncbi:MULTISPECIES: adenylate/guanylate cyclase domain-containing protein [unclassified Rhizobium]|uniref:CHASE2 domain-containing protein n=1 Tax=unclassified Rhizobium TaxID=2613769 RepID=UPI00084C8F42|nr:MULTISPECIES: adenylate/guanylate cyclase domain-containing protein [unclassified Rhizobium]OEC99083.1 adenylate cyclase [Rhizobium sp. YK2]QYA11691.1 adenylate/guanylate cyclase domain-containing protein [Rhizobium sp. AB2/73]UEQ82379.1 adenylate/guanylate cyclase domain-containing protein [Rhizobium sp. AB2/73]
MRRPPLQTLIALFLTAVWGIGLGVAHLRGDIPFVDGAEATLTNLRNTLGGSFQPPDLVTIIAIDDETSRMAGHYPLPRATLAKMIDAVGALGPKVVALDLLLVDAGDEADDAALEQSLKRNKVVLAAAGIFPESRQRVTEDSKEPLARVPSALQFLEPQQRFADVASYGIVNVQTDKAGTPRFVPLLFRSGERIEPSFSLRVVSAATNEQTTVISDHIKIGDRSIQTDTGYLMPLSFYGPRGTIRTVSASAALNGQLPEAAIKDHIIVIGATVTGGGDVFPTPFDPVLPGVEVIATSITHLIAGDGLVRDRNVRFIDLYFALGLPLLVIALLSWRRSTIGPITVLGVMLVWFAVNVSAFKHGIWLSAALPIAATAPPMLLYGAAQLWLDRRRATRFAEQSELLQRIEAPGLAEHLARDPDFLASPVQQEAAVVFIDINGFTGLSEAIGPAAVRELLNGFYNLVDEEVTASGGAITSFMGDGAMILFGLPQPKPSDPANAAHCCIRLAARMKGWLSALPETVASRIGFKIGAHCGTIVASRLGGGGRQQITATGDTVNVASRLMEVAASNRAEIAISHELLLSAGRDSAPFNEGSLDGPIETGLRGRAGTLTIWLWRSWP